VSDVVKVLGRYLLVVVVLGPKVVLRKDELGGLPAGFRRRAACSMEAGQTDVRPSDVMRQGCKEHELKERVKLKARKDSSLHVMVDGDAVPTARLGKAERRSCFLALLVVRCMCTVKSCKNKKKKKKVQAII